MQSKPSKAPTPGLVSLLTGVAASFWSVQSFKPGGRLGSLMVVLLWGALSARAERINHEGRILGTVPVITNVILFNTTNADAVVSAMQIFPATNPWNEDISRRSVLANSDAMIAQISADLPASRRVLRVFKEMNFVLVPDAQPPTPINFFNYPEESDLGGGVFPEGLYPIPSNLPIETWPSETGALTLAEWQQDMNSDGGDRHAIVVQPGRGWLWETWQTRLLGSSWEASNGAKFDLNGNGLRPAGWTSGDAAGLPMFAALPRFDECERGMVEHACRIVVKRTRYNRYLYPATHYASAATNTNPDLPAMGQRLRLKSGYPIPANWTKHEKAVLLALKKYGALVADNGNFFSISITPDDRWPAGGFDHLATIGITNFEVIQTTGPEEGPRSPGAPVASAGPDQSGIIGVPLPLPGFVDFTNAFPTTNQWKLHSGPTNLVFANAAQTNTTATFQAPGNYTLMLSAADNVHAVAYDAVVVTVSPTIALAISGAGGGLNLSWSGGTPPYVVERTDALVAPLWSGVVTTSVQSITVPKVGNSGFFRVRAN